MRAKIKNGAYYYDNLTQVATETHNGNVYQKYIYHDMSICKSKEGKDLVISFHVHSTKSPDYTEMINCAMELGFTKKLPIRHYVSQFHTHYIAQEIV